MKSKYFLNTGLGFGLLAAGAVLDHSIAWSVPVSQPPIVAAAVPVADFTTLSQRAIPSVVNISATKRQQLEFDFPMHMPNSTSLGSGFVIDASGIILTNNHVVANADEIFVQFTESADEVPTEGKVIGRDKELDVALIQVKPPKKLTALSLGDSDELKVGEYVMAVGNPYGQGHSISHGIVSAKGRVAPGIPIANYIQTDAPINPGNSGGPLLNLKGEVIGINNAIDPRAQGISFAIPINFVKQVLEPLKSKGLVRRGFIGAVVGQLARADLRAPLVTEVMPGSPAERAGLRPNDTILEVSSKAVHSPADLVMAVTSVPIGTEVPLKISRGGVLKNLSIRTALRPNENES